MWVDKHKNMWGQIRIEVIYKYLLFNYPTLQGPYIPLSRNLSKMWGYKSFSCGFCYMPTSNFGDL